MTPNPQILLDFDGWKSSLPANQRAAVDKQLSIAPDREAETKRIQNIFWIAQQNRLKPGQVNGMYDMALGTHALRAGWGPLEGTDAFHARAVKDATDYQNEIYLVAGKEGDDEEARAMRAASMNSAAYIAGTKHGAAGGVVEAFADWQTTAKGKGYRPQHSGNYFPVFSARYMEGAKEAREAKAVAAEILPILQSVDDWTGTGLDAVFPALAKLTGNFNRQLPLVIDEVKKLGGKPMEDKGLQMGKSLNRGARSMAESIGGFIRGMDADSASTEEEYQRRMKLHGLRSLIVDQMRKTGTEIDPIHAESWWETSLNLAAESVPSMAGAFATLGAANFMAYTHDAETALLEKGVPGMAARAAAGIVGGAQAALDRVQLGFLKKIPGVESILTKYSTSALTKAIGRAGAITASEVAVELVQDQFVPAAMQSIMGALNADIPQVNWSDVAKETWAQTPETFLAMLPLALLGAGVAAVRDVKNANSLVANPRALAALGFDQASIDYIQLAAENGEGAKALRREWENRKPVIPGDGRGLSTTAAKELTDTFFSQNPDQTPALNPSLGIGLTATGSGNSIPSSTVDASPSSSDSASPSLSPVAPVALEPGEEESVGEYFSRVGVTDVRRTSEGWTVTLENGKVVQTGDIEATQAILHGLGTAATESGAAAMVGLANEIAARDSGVEQQLTGDLLSVLEGEVFRTTPGGVTRRVSMEAASAQTLGQQLEFLGEQSGVIQGSNWIREDGIRIAKSNVSQEGIFTQVHEFAEGRLRGIMATPEGQMSVIAAARVLAPLRQFRDNQHLQNIASGKTTETEARETMVEMIVADVLSRRKTGEYFQPGTIAAGINDALSRALPAETKQSLTWFRALMKAVRSYLHGLFSTAAKLTAARRDGSIKEGDDFTALANKMLGLDEQVAHEEAVAEAVRKSAETFSLARPLAASDDVKGLRKLKTEWSESGFSDQQAEEIISKFYKRAAFAAVPRGALLVPMPSTSGRNSLPVKLADRIAADFGNPIFAGNAGITTARAEAKTKTGFWAKMEDPVQFVAGPDLAKLIETKLPVVIVEDVHNTGESWVAFADFLFSHGIEVADVAALTATDGRLTSARDIERLAEKLANFTGKPVAELKPLADTFFNGSFKQFFNKAEAIVTGQKAAERLVSFIAGSEGKGRTPGETQQRNAQKVQRAQSGARADGNQLSLFGESFSLGSSESLLQPRITSGISEEIEVERKGPFRTYREEYATAAGRMYRFVKIGDDERIISAMQVRMDGPRSKSGVISGIYTEENERRKGNAGSLLRYAQESFKVRHSRDLTTDGKAFKAADGTSYSLGSVNTLEAIAARLEERRAAGGSAVKLEAYADLSRRLEGMARAARSNEETEAILRAGEIEQQRKQLQKTLEDEKMLALYSGPLGEILTADESAAVKDDPFLQQFLAPEKDIKGSKRKGVRGVFKSRQKGKGRPGEENAGEYEDAAYQGIPDWMFKGDQMPDEVATSMGMTVPEMWEKLGEALAANAKLRARNEKAREAVAEAKAEARKEARDWATAERAKLASSDKRDSKRSLVTLDVILAELPAEVRKKVGGFTDITELKTDASRRKRFLTMIDKIDVAFEDWLRAEFVSNIQEAMKKAAALKKPGEKDKGKLGVNAHTWLEVADDIMRMSPVRLAEREAFIEKHLDGEPMTEDIIADFNRAWDFGTGEDAARLAMEQESALLDLFGGIAHRDKGGRYVRTSSEMEAAFNAMQETIDRGRNDFAEVLRARRDRRAGRRAGVMIDSGKQGRYSERQEANMEAEGLGGQFRNFLRKGMNFEQFLGDIFGRESDTHRWAEETVMQARLTGEGLWQDAQSRLTEFLKSLWPKTSKVGILRNLEALQKSREVPGAGKGFAELSELEAIHFTMLWSDPDSREWLNAHGFGDGKASGGPDVQAALESMLSPAALKIRAFLVDSYDSQYDSLNEVFRRLHGVNMPRVRNYAPRAVLSGKEAAVADPLSGGQVTARGVFAGFTKRRRPQISAAPQVTDALVAFVQNQRVVSHFLGWAETSSELRAVFSTSETAPYIEAAAGRNGLVALNEWLSDLEQNGVREAMEMASLNRWLRANADNALVGKLGVLAKQLSAIYGSATELGWGEYARSAGRLARGQAVITADEAAELPVMKQRTFNRPSEVGQAAAGSGPRKYARALRRAGVPVERIDLTLDFLRERIGATDAYFTARSAAIAYDAKYREGIAMKMSDTAARQYAEKEMTRAVFRTAQPDNVATKSKYENRTQGAWKLLFAFQSMNRQMLFSTVAAFRDGGIKNAKAWRLGLTHWALTGFITQVIGSAIRDWMSDDDEDKDWQASDFARAMALGPLTGALHLGPVIESVTAALGWGYEQRQAPGIQQSVGTMARVIWNAINSEDGITAKQAEQGGRAVGMAGQTAFGGFWSGLNVLLNLGKQGVGVVDNAISTAAGQ
jgi:hypothetical protein